MRNYPRVYTSFMPNAPIMNGVPGAMLDIIKKCLNGGWTPFDAQSIVVTNGIGVININAIAKVSIPDGCILAVSGCDEPQLNTEWFIHQGTNTKAFFETTVADGTYGGSIKVVPVPAGWDILFSGANQAVIRSSNDDSSRTCVQIVDTSATHCNFEFGTDATSVSQLIDNTYIQNSYTKSILKSRNAVAANFRGWAIICDNTTVFIVTDLFSFGSSIPLGRDGFLGGRVQFFGDYIPNEVSDTEAFASYFQSLDPAATDNAITTDCTPQSSGIFTSNAWGNARPTVRSSLYRYNKWNWGVFCPQADITNPTYRQSGSTSNLGLQFITDLEKSHRRCGVYSRGSGGTSAISLMGVLPGIRYSDYFIRSMFQTFSSSVDKTDNTRYVYIPIDWGNRSSNLYDASWGMIPFIINRKWGD